MWLLRIIANALLMLSELAAVIGLTILATRMPLVFSAATALVALCLGGWLEQKRLRFELPFYVERVGRFGALIAVLVGVTTSFSKALMVGFLALLTFSGTNTDRRFWIAVVMSVTIYTGVSLLRRLWLSFGIRSARWGYFQLALPLGILFALLVALLASAKLIETPSLATIMRQLVLEVPSRPTIAQVTELLFQLKLYIDAVIVWLLATMMPRDWAQLIGLIVSVNVLAGLVAAVWAVIISATSIWIEQRLPVPKSARTTKEQETGKVQAGTGKVAATEP